jgi:hypothetical protein
MTVHRAQEATVPSPPTAPATTTAPGPVAPPQGRNRVRRDTVPPTTGLVARGCEDQVARV